jgi:tripeptide aminopeptidase
VTGVVEEGLVEEGRHSRLHASFEQLCRIPSVTGNERAVADWLTAELQGLGLKVTEDGAGAIVPAGANAGNLLVRIPGRRQDWLFLCAHMDTVPLTADPEPVIRDGGWENAGEGIIGADNKAAVACLVELAHHLVAEPAEIGVELLFTISEETGLNGAAAFDLTQLHSAFGYVFDHASPIGEIIVASPTHMRLRATVRGRAAHAGLHPEQGVNAITAAARGITALPQGRLDAETTANIGLISGGTASNVVAERCAIEWEVRAIEQERVDTVVTEAVDALQDAADGYGCDLDIELNTSFTGYRVRLSERSVVLAERALRRIGYEPRPISSGGGSDANAFRLGGFQCTNLANGTERAHEPGERVGIRELEDGFALVSALIDEWTDEPTHPAGIR